MTVCRGQEMPGHHRVIATLLLPQGWFTQVLDVGRLPLDLTLPLLPGRALGRALRRISSGLKHIGICRPGPEYLSRAVMLLLS